MKMEYLNKWDKAIIELSEKEIKYDKLKEKYLKDSDRIIRTTDFKEIYGKNNADVRKAHINEVLFDLNEEIKDLKYSINYLKRRIDWYKIACKIEIND